MNTLLLLYVGSETIFRNTDERDDITVKPAKYTASARFWTCSKREQSCGKYYLYRYTHT